MSSISLIDHTDWHYKIKKKLYVSEEQTFAKIIQYYIITLNSFRFSIFQQVTHASRFGLHMIQGKKSL